MSGITRKDECEGVKKKRSQRPLGLDTGGSEEGELFKEQRAPTDDD